MKGCIFCQIVNGELPCYKIFEDDHTLAFLDIGKEADGHTIVIPKTHIANILDCDDETLGHVMSAAKRISNHYVDHCGYTAVNLLNASGTDAEQSVPHFHFHIIPRKNNDGIHAWPNLKERENTLDEMYRLLKIQ
ncbi:HIT-like protein [Clostridium sp. C105KSO15]|nr:HIT-like protein [Clostridium sp. C105KSO15]